MMRIYWQWLGRPGTLITNRRHYLKHLRPQPPSTTRAQPPASTTGAQSPSANRAHWKMLFQLYDPAPSIVFWCKIYSEDKVVFLNFLIWAYLNWKVVLAFYHFKRPKQFFKKNKGLGAFLNEPWPPRAAQSTNWLRLTWIIHVLGLGSPTRSQHPIAVGFIWNWFYIGQNISTPKI